MNIVDALLKIKQIEKDKIALQLEVAQLKKELKQQDLLTATLYVECNKLSEELNRWKPFENYDKLIIKSKLNQK